MGTFVAFGTAGDLGRGVTLRAPAHGIVAVALGRSQGHVSGRSLQS